MKVTQPYLQIRSNAIVVYWLPLNHFGKRHQLKLPTYSGKVNSHVKRRMVSALDVMVQRADAAAAAAAEKFGTEKRLVMNFVTLTIAQKQNLSVSECYKKLLSKWLRYMKSKQGMTDYVWKAEYQKRGQVHYHVAVDKFIDWRVVRWKWNQLQRRERMLDDFAKKYGHFNPNSTDIHAMKSVVNCLDYIAKEMCKDIQNQKVTKGKVWDCSESLKRGRFSDELRQENMNLLDDALQHGFATEVKAENCVVVKLREPLKVLTENQRSQYFSHIK